MGKTTIEWTAAQLPDGTWKPGFTFNPWIGCTRVSAGCDHCYAESLAKRHGWAEWGNHPRRRTSASTWKQPLKWNREAAASGTRARVFCASLADVFDNQVSEAWRNDLWDLIEQCQQLDWLLLTKRPQNIARMLPPPRVPSDWTDRGKRLPWPWDNVWLGTTVENQEEADRRIPHLLAVPAKVHFLSCEPLLGSIDLTNVNPPKLPYPGEAHGTDVLTSFNKILRPQIDWVIVGGESGGQARPMNPQWARDLRDQCRIAGVAFFHKQNGEFASVSDIEGAGPHHTFPDGRTVRRVGKSRAGRLLDGIEHNGFP